VPKIILAHNHPSGDATPSEEDLLFTRRLEEACHLLGIGLVDHLVVCEGSFTSFRREGLL
jgi:DNA repair protein RadC